MRELLIKKNLSITNLFQIVCTFKGKHNYSYMDLADNSESVRALFFIGNATEDFNKPIL